VSAFTVITFREIRPINIAVRCLIAGIWIELAGNPTLVLKLVFLTSVLPSPQPVLKVEWYVVTLVLFYRPLFLEL
jgi:hypothetical protein